MTMPSGWMIAIIAVLIILLFGAPKLPKLAKSMGQSMRIFNSEVKTMRTENGKGSDSAGQQNGQEEDGDQPAVEGRVINPERRSGTESRDEHR